MILAGLFLGAQLADAVTGALLPRGAEANPIVAAMPIAAALFLKAVVVVYGILLVRMAPKYRDAVLGAGVLVGGVGLGSNLGVLIGGMA
jgi:hypothetical protein